MKKFELKHFEYFLAVANHLSFTKAANEIRVAQPAISQQIKYLELVLGLPLFNRDNKKVSLTEAGLLFKKQAEKVLGLIDQTIDILEELKGLARGTVSIGMSSTVAAVLMADLTRQFKNQFPDIKLRFAEYMTIDSIQQIISGKIDLGVITLPVDYSKQGLFTQHLFDEDLEVIVSNKHTLALKNQESIRLKELTKYQWILPNKSNNLRKLIDQGCEEKGFCPLALIEVDRINSVRNLLVYSREGVSILPPTSVVGEISLGLLKRIKIKDAKLYRSVGLASRAKENLTPATIEMIKLIKKTCYKYPQYSFYAYPASSENVEGANF